MVCETACLKVCPCAEGIWHTAAQNKASGGPLTADHGQCLYQLSQKLSSCVAKKLLSLR